MKTSLRFIVLLHALISVAAVYLIAVYGRLHWWFRDAARAGLDDRQLAKGFFQALEHLPILAVCLAACVTASSVLLWREKIAPGALGVGLFAFSVISLTICLLIRF